MKILGIVAEYNPMHYGHLYHLTTARAETKCEYVIVAMSGNYVQRGEPAIVSKWVRAKMALAAGADLVLEIPAWFSLQSAEGFARAGVQLLDNCGVTHMSFGSESGNIDDLRQLARWLQQPRLQANIRETLASGITYAAAVEQAAHSLAPHLSHLLRSPNNILGVEYLRAMENSALSPHTVPRNPEHANASQIRELLARGETKAALRHIPPLPRGLLAAALKRTAPLSIENLSQGIFYALINLGVKGIKSLPACSEGLENRIYKAFAGASNIRELIEAVKTRRYPYTRIRRLLLQALLRFDTAESPGKIPYLRVLAVSPRGKELLPVLARSPLPLLYSPRDKSKLKPQDKKFLSLEIRGEEIYKMAQRMASPAELG